MRIPDAWLITLSLVAGVVGALIVCVIFVWKVRPYLVIRGQVSDIREQQTLVRDRPTDKMAPVARPVETTNVPSGRHALAVNGHRGHL